MSQIRPMEQFEVQAISPLHFLGMDISITNAALWMFFAFLFAFFITFSSMGDAKLVPRRFQNIGELLYEFVAKMVHENVGNEGKPYFPYIFTLFIFILSLNLLGMIPHGFAVTGQIIVTFTLALISWLVVVFAGFRKHGIGFLKLFVPSGIPVYLLPLITVIEIISYVVRPFSLAIRLFANILAGHTMLFVFGAFVVLLGLKLGWLPLGFMAVVDSLEFLVAMLQAYVFAVLVCIYLGEALSGGHGEEH